MSSVDCLYIRYIVASKRYIWRKLSRKPGLGNNKGNQLTKGGEILMPMSWPVNCSQQ